MTSEELPKGWARAAVGDLIGTDGLFVDGDWVESKDQDPDGEVRLTQLADVGDGVWRNRSDRYMTAAKAGELRCTYLAVDDVLVARMPDPLGRACLFPGDAQPCVTVVDVAVVRPGPSSVVPRWLMHTLNAPQVRSEIDSLQAGTTRKRISRKNLATIELPLPPVSEQERIVAETERRLSHVDGAERSVEVAVRRLGLARRAVLEGVTNGSLLGLAATKWDQVTAGDITEVRGGIQKQPKRKPLDNKYPFLRVANVGRGALDLAEVHEVELFNDELSTYRLRRGDLLVVEGNGSVDQIGRAAMWDGSIADCVHQNHLIRVRPGERILADFLALVWNAPSTIAQLVEVASSTSGLHTLSTATVKAVKLAVPSLEEQQRLVNEANRRLSLLDAAERSVATSQRRCRQLRRSVLAAALHGELVPQDPNDEPAEVLLQRIRDERATAAQSKAVKKPSTSIGRKPRTKKETAE